MNPIQTTIESLHAKQRCPRLHVDTTRPGIEVPDFVRERWKEQLVIDLDPQYPLELEFTAVGVEANLSFGGFVTRCVFPWEAVYIVVDRETGRGLVIESIVPRAVKERQAAAAGATRLVLETGTGQPDAQRFYEREGYERVPLFGPYAASTISVCYGRTL